MFDAIAFLYRDPLFGIIILIAIITILVFADYGRNKYRAKKRQIAIENFTKSYNENAPSDEFVDFLSLAKNPIPPLLLLAKTYARAGDSAYAIKIYLAMLEKTRDIQEKIIVLESLGITYFEAGFLQRAKNIFLEILKIYPRNAQILSYLMRTHESMGEYQDALDVLECFDELSTPKEQQENEHIRTYLHFMLLAHNHILPFHKKNKEIIELMHYSGMINRLGLDYLFVYARELFWEELLRMPSIEFCLDILWRCKQEEIPFDILSKRTDIVDVFVAKGYLQRPESSVAKTQEDRNLLDSKDHQAPAVPLKTKKTPFELEVLCILRRYSKQKGDLIFEYRCHHCKNIFPFDSYRCPICANVGEMDLAYRLKEYSMEIL